MFPDFDRTVTGYPWLDRLTRPVWSWWYGREEQKFYQWLGNGNEKLGREALRQAATEAETDRARASVCACGLEDCKSMPGRWE